MSSDQDFKCVFCSETFSQKEELQIHFRKHGDPNFNQKKPTSRSQDEADVSAEKPRDQTEAVECDVCSEMFSSISKAITHKHKMHPDHDTKYFCPWCGKLFTMKHLYNKHMQSSHSEKEKSCERLFHCDSCDVDFNIPAAMVYHNKFYHRQDDLPTLGHSKKLKMILEEVMQIYYCPFCGDEFDNKVNLHKHMSEDHSSENQSPEDVFRCPLCDAVFYYLDAYELHLTYHSGEDLYTERSELMDEIIDFSLETVQPLQEKVESVDPGNGGQTPIAIEDLLEFTMGDGSDIRKPKKHKKHKKSKKAAITLDEFLNMNKDVFGEGIDFQGIEEVPTQVVAKRLKTKKVPVSTSSDLAKLKKQGIVVKKQSNTARKPLILKKRPSSTVVNNQTLYHKVQKKSSVLTSTDDVLSKLLNQGSQIKIVKKSNPDTEEHIQQDENSDEDKSSKNNIETNTEEGNNPSTDVNKTEETNAEVNEGEDDTNNSKANIIKQNSHAACSPNQKTLAIIGQNTDFKHTQYDTNGSNHDLNECSNHLQKDRNLPDNLVALRNNANIIIKSSKQNVSEIKINNRECRESDDEDAQTEEPNPEDDAERNAASSEKSSLNALKHLSHLITIKSVNSSHNLPLSGCNKPQHSLQKPEAPKTPPQNNIPKKTEANNLANLKNLSSITIKTASNTQSHIPTKDYLPVEAKENDEGADNETDDKWNAGASGKKSIENNGAVDKIAHLLKSPQLSVQTKHSPKIIQIESPKLISTNDNSQSSTDLLKHLKNVTAKPVNVNTQNILTPKCSPSALKRSTKAVVPPQEVTEDGIEIFNIEDSDSDDANSHSITKKLKHHTEIKTENTMDTNKSMDALKNINKNITIKSNNQHNKIVKNESLNHSCKEFDDEDDDWGEDYDEKYTHTSPTNTKINIAKPNQKNVAVNNVLKNLRKKITVKSRNSSPQSVQDHNSKKSYIEANEGDSDSDSPSGRVKITEMENSDDEFPEETAENNLHQLVKVQHPDDSHSEHEDGQMDDDFDDMSDIESQIEAAKVQKCNSKPSSCLKNLNHLNKNLTVKPAINKSTVNSKPENALPSDEIPQFAKNLSNQISIKQIKKPESNNNAKTVDQTVSHSMNQSPINQKMASTSNQLNTFNKEVKTVKTFQTQTKTVIQEIITTVTKTIKTVNQTTKQEVRNMAQSSSTPMIPQKIQGTMNTTFSQKNFQGVKVRQAPPNIRPKIRGQAPQVTRPAICAPPLITRATIPTPVRACNQLVPMRPVLNRPSGPRPRMPNATNVRASTSGQQRPRVGRPVKVSPGAIYSSPKKPAEAPGHFSCFKKPRESLIPEPDFPLMNQSDGESIQFSSAVQMSKCNFSSTSKTVKGNSVVTSTQMKSEMSASSQQLSKLRNMSGLSVVKTSQNQAKQTHVIEKSEMSESKRNALSAIQKLQSQGLLVKKPRLDASEESDHSQPGSDDMGHDSNEEFDV